MKWGTYLVFNVAAIVIFLFTMLIIKHFERLEPQEALISVVAGLIIGTFFAYENTKNKS